MQEAATAIGTGELTDGPASDPADRHVPPDRPATRRRQPGAVAARACRDGNRVRSAFGRT